MLVRVELQPAVAARLYSYHQLVLARALAHRDVWQLVNKQGGISIAAYADPQGMKRMKMRCFELRKIGRRKKGRPWYCSPAGWCMVIYLPTLVTNPVAAAARNANTSSARGSSLYNSIFWASDTLKAGCPAGAVGGARGCSAADVATIVSAMPVFLEVSCVDRNIFPA